MLTNLPQFTIRADPVGTNSVTITFVLRGGSCGTLALPARDGFILINLLEQINTWMSAFTNNHVFFGVEWENADSKRKLIEMYLYAMRDSHAQA